MSVAPVKAETLIHGDEYIEIAPCCAGRIKRRAADLNLAIGVGDADIIHVDQGDLVDTGAGQRLCRPGTDATDPHHTDLGLAKGTQGVLTIKTGNAPESL